MPPISHFTIRVYALIFDSEERILLSDEFQMGQRMTKFPGGGLNFGEGLVDCLKREAMEEFGQEIEIIRHFYTTDFFQKALFFKDHQLLSVYYEARFKEPPRFRISKKPFDFSENINGSQSFRWMDINQLKPADLTFPIDQYVCKQIKIRYPQ